jgi:hypothetical protein
MRSDCLHDEVESILSLHDAGSSGGKESKKLSGFMGKSGPADG